MGNLEASVADRKKTLRKMLSFDCGDIGSEGGHHTPAALDEQKKHPGRSVKDDSQLVKNDTPLVRGDSVYIDLRQKSVGSGSFGEKSPKKPLSLKSGSFGGGSFGKKKGSVKSVKSFESFFVDPMKNRDEKKFGECFDKVKAIKDTLLANKKKDGLTEEQVGLVHDLIKESKIVEDRLMERAQSVFWNEYFKKCKASDFESH